MQMVLYQEQNQIGMQNQPKESLQYKFWFNYKMGNICIKKQNEQQLINSEQNQEVGKSIKARMDKTQYKRIQDIKQFLTLDSSASANLLQNKNNEKSKRLINDFKFVKALGDGSYGEVLMVKDTKSDQFYAMKIIKKDLILERDQILNALSQRHILAVVDHPFIVKLHYAFQTKNKIYLIMDLMTGGQLFYLLRKNRKFSQQVAKFYAAQILLALQYLHSKKIIYRDLKPQNILLDKQGHIKVTDFGLSKVCLKKNQLSYSICGTPQYIAPQILKGKGYSVSADWFSFGSLLYDMMTGKPPFYSKNKQQIIKKIQTKQIPFPQYLSNQAKSLLKQLFTKKPQNRLGFKKGAQQIKNHAFFLNINFQDILTKKADPPFKFQDHINPQGFATKFDDIDLLESYQNQIFQKSKGVVFDGFTYQKDNQKNQLNLQRNDGSYDYNIRKESINDNHNHSLLSPQKLQGRQLTTYQIQEKLLVGEQK